MKRIAYLVGLVVALAAGVVHAMTARQECHVVYVPCMTTVDGDVEFCQEEKCRAFLVWYPYGHDDRVGGQK
jgi:hypothetical protein